MSLFHFKQFSIDDTDCAMKTGIDSILLGSYIPKQNVSNVLDIGSGSGIISLMMAQKFPEAKITGVEIEPKAHQRSIENAMASKWKERIHFINDNIQKFSKEAKTQFDLIISNPPFFSNSLKSYNLNKNTARHNDDLCFDDLILSIKKLLMQTGTAWIIFPSQDFESMKAIINQHELEVQHKLEVYNKENGKISRNILAIGHSYKKLTFNEISIRNQDNEFTNAYKELCKEYYLHL